MKRSLFMAAILVAGPLAFAEAGPRVVNAKDYTCAELKAIVQAEGVIIHKGWLGGEQQYVANTSHCEFGKSAVPAYDVSKDAKFCQVGSTCEGELYGD